MAKTALGFTPVVGDALSAYDALDALGQGNYGDAALAALGLLPFIPNIGGKAAVSAERLARERNYYGYHDNTSKGVLVMMPPQRFLQLAVEGGPDVTRRAAKLGPFDVDKFNKEFLPYLTVDRKKGQVVDHEGRARAARALQDKIPEIPVVISARDQRWASADELPSILKREHSGERIPLLDVTPVELLLTPPMVKK